MEASAVAPMHVQGMLLSDATVTNQAIAAAKRKLESEMQTLHVS